MITELVLLTELLLRQAAFLPAETSEPPFLRVPLIFVPNYDGFLPSSKATSPNGYEEGLKH